MSRRGAGAVIKSCWCIGLGVFLLIAIYFMFDTAKEICPYVTAQVFWEEASFTGKALEQMLERDSGVKLSAYSKGRQEDVATYVLEDKVKAEVIDGVGNMAAITSKRLMGGSWIMENETCIIDRHIAEALFGSTDVVNQMIKIGDRDYIISGIIEGSEGVIYCLAKENTQFSNLLLTLEEPTNTRETVEKFLMQYQLPKANLMIITDELEFLVGVMVRLPVFVLYSLFLGVSFYTLKHATYKKPLRRVIGSVCLVLLGGFFAVQFFNLTMPQSLIPTKWSNAAFYKETMGQFKEQLNCFLSMKKPPYLQIMQQQFLTLLGWGVAFMIASGGLLLTLKEKQEEADLPSGEVLEDTEHF